MNPEEMLESCLKAAIPELRIALESAFKTGGVHIFDIAQGRNLKTGSKMKFVCFIAPQPYAIVLEGTLKGIDESQKYQLEELVAAQKATS